MKLIPECKALVVILFLVFQFSRVAAEQPGSSGQAKEQSRPVRLACNVFPPQKIALPTETDFPGYDIELIQAAFDARKIKTEFAFFPWKRAYLLVKSGEYDALCSCSWLPERDQDFWYSQEMGRVAKGVFTLDYQGFKNLEDLRGKTIGVVSGYNLEAELKAAGVFAIHSVVADDLLLNLLIYRRVEAIYSYENTIRSLLKERHDSRLIRFQELESAPYYLCVSRALNDGQSMIKEFNLGMKFLRDTRRYEQIIQRYLPGYVD